MSESQSTYDATKAFAVLDRLEAEPWLGLREILRQAEIPKSTFHDWRKQHPELEEAYVAAKLEGFDHLAHRAQATARGNGPDKGGDSTKDVQRDKLIIDTDLKLLSKWYQAKYGDRTVLAGDPDAPLRGMSDEELDAKLAAKFAAAGIPNA